MKKMKHILCAGLAAALFCVYSLPFSPASSEASAASQPEMQKGQPLKEGDTIGVLAPASHMNSRNTDAAVKFLKQMGYKIKLAPSATAAYGYFAGTDVQRATDINRFFADDEVDAILCLRGGYGSARILNYLDYEAIRQHPKQFIGYSDITALHIALAQKGRLATVHGPMLGAFATSTIDQTDFTEETFFLGIRNELYPGEIPLPPGGKLRVITPGEAEGFIIGGNLTVLTSLIGTPYEPDGKGALLFLEDVDEDTYRVDRMLQQLWQNGLLSRVNGVLIGDFINADEDYEEGDFRLDEVLDYYAKLSGKPWIKGIPAGHGEHNLYLPFGIHAVMRAGEDGSASLRITESASAAVADGKTAAGEK